MRVLHAPDNIANQMTALARGLRACGIEAATCEFRPNWPKYPVDFCLHLDRAPTRMHRRLRQWRFFLWAASHFDVFHFHYGGSLLSQNRDLVWLARLGRLSVMHYWGDDVRPRRTDRDTDVERRRVRRVQRVARHVRAALVADSELRSYVEPYFREIAIVRQAIDLDAFDPAPPAADTRVPLVVHAPSAQAAKGTPAILAAIERLRTTHGFAFQLVEKTPHEQAVAIYRAADVVIDQIAAGTHGLLAVEAMALAKPVICYIDPARRDSYPLELPVVSATGATLPDVLADLLNDGLRRRQLGEAGRAYVEQYHDARTVAGHLCTLYRRWRTR